MQYPVEDRQIIDDFMRSYDEGHHVDVETFMRNYHKPFLYKLLENQYIYEKEIDIKKDDNMLTHIAYSSEAYKYFTEITDIFCNTILYNDNTDIFPEEDQYYKDEFGTNLRSNLWKNAGHMLRGLSTTNLIHNKVSETYNLVLSNGLRLRSQKGQKLTSFFSNLLKTIRKAEEDGKIHINNHLNGSYDVVSYEDMEDKIELFRIALSQLLNDKVMKGILCLSIHPMDFLTMSDNTYGWSSCMSWEEEGCYHAGTIEMMNSSYVICAYIKGDADEYLQFYDSFWNSKKWRELFAVSPEFVVSMCGYPYRNSEMEDVIFAEIADLAKKNCGIEYNLEKKIEANHNRFFDGKLRFTTDLMYNDLANKSGSRGIFTDDFAENRSHTGYATKSINLSDNGAICLECGEELDIESSHFCSSCHPVCRCESCGESLPNEDYQYWYEDYVYCECCYCDLFAYCEVSYQDYPVEDMYWVIFRQINHHAYDYKTGTYHTVEQSGTIAMHYDYYKNIRESLNDSDEYQVGINPEIDVIFREYLSKAGWRDVELV